MKSTFLLPGLPPMIRAAAAKNAGGGQTVGPITPVGESVRIARTSPQASSIALSAPPVTAMAHHTTAGGGTGNASVCWGVGGPRDLLESVPPPWWDSPKYFEKQFC